MGWLETSAARRVTSQARFRREIVTPFDRVHIAITPALASIQQYIPQDTVATWDERRVSSTNTSPQLPPASVAKRSTHGCTGHNTRWWPRPAGRRGDQGGRGAGHAREARMAWMACLTSELWWRVDGWMVKREDEGKQDGWMDGFRGKV